ncbi:MAG: hypothetical protein ACRD2Z_11945 [Thermoanaerobaculia bacterium]
MNRLRADHHILCYPCDPETVLTGQKLASAILAMQLLVPLVWAPLRLAPLARECTCDHAHSHCTDCACPVPPVKRPQPECHGSGPGAQCSISSAGKSAPVALLTVLDELFRGATMPTAARLLPPRLNGVTRPPESQAPLQASPAPPTPPPQPSFRVA